MLSDTDFRKDKRFSHQATIMIVEEESKLFSYGKLCNFSEDGAYVKSDISFPKGGKLVFNLSRPIFKAAPTKYRAIVQWCKELNGDNSQYPFGVGLKIL